MKKEKISWQKQQIKIKNIFWGKKGKKGKYHAIYERIKVRNKFNKFIYKTSLHEQL